MDVVCLGILVADVIARPVDDVPLAGSLSIVDVITVEGGGCAFNTASTLAKFGLRAEVMGKVGVDPFGDVLVELLDERGVGRTGVLRDPNVPTSSTIVLVDSAGERTFLHAPGANGALGIDELDLDSLYSGRALHFAGALVMERLDGEPFAGLAAEAQRRGIFTSLDTVWDPTGAGLGSSRVCHISTSRHRALPRVSLCLASGSRLASPLGYTSAACVRWR